MSRETISPSAATSFINIGERTNVTGESVMLGLGPSIQRAPRDGGSEMHGHASLLRELRSRYAGVEVDPRDKPEDDSVGTPHLGGGRTRMTMRGALS